MVACFDRWDGFLTPFMSLKKIGTRKLRDIRCFLIVGHCSNKFQVRSKLNILDQATSNPNVFLCCLRRCWILQRVRVSEEKEPFEPRPTHHEIRTTPYKM